MNTSSTVAEADTTSAPDAAERAGITYRQLDHWIYRGYIHAEGGHGSGYPRHLTPEEVEVLKFTALLVRHGFVPAQAADLARQLHHDGRAHLGLFVITTNTPDPDRTTTQEIAS